MEIQDTRLKELDGKQVSQEEIDDLAEDIMTVKKAKVETPQLYQAAMLACARHGDILMNDEEIAKISDQPKGLDAEIEDLKKDNPAQKRNNLKEKMKAAAQEYKLKKKPSEKTASK